MPQYIPQNTWDQYKEIINNFHEDAFKEEIIWERHINVLSEHGEDGSNTSQLITLEGLVGYNDFRNWPINVHTTSGETDKQNLQLWLNLKYLEGLGYTNEHNLFQFNPGLDYFHIRGQKYKSSGESGSAQAQGTPLLFFIILKREEIATSDNPY